MQKKADDWWFGMSANKRYDLAKKYDVKSNFSQARLIIYCTENMISLPEYLSHVAHSKNK